MVADRTPAHTWFGARPRPAGAGSPTHLPIVAKAGAVALLCSATALAAVMALSGFDRDGDRTPSSSATAETGVGSAGGVDGAPGAINDGGNGTTRGGGGAGPAAGAMPANGSPSATAGALNPGAPGGSTSARSVGVTPSPTGGSATEEHSPSASSQPVGSGTTAPANPAGQQTSRCADTTGDQSAEGVGDIDLVEVTLRRSDTGLTVRFGLAAPLSAPAASATPTMTSWQVLMAQGDDVVYAFTVSSVDGAWESSLVDFASPEGDRFGAMSPASGQAIEVLIPDADLGRLPDRFTWWATSLTDRLVSQGLFANDDCPSGSGVTEAGLALPPESRRASFG